MKPGLFQTWNRRRRLYRQGFGMEGNTDKFDKIRTAILTYATRLWHSPPPPPPKKTKSNITLSDTNITPIWLRNLTQTNQIAIIPCKVQKKKLIAFNFSRRQDSLRQKLMRKWRMSGHGRFYISLCCYLEQLCHTARCHRVHSEAKIDVHNSSPALGCNNVN